MQEIVDHFSDKQKEALDAVFKYDFVLYGGARYGGKSHWLRWVNVILLLKWFNVDHLRNVRTGLFCESYPTLKDRQIGKIASPEFPTWLGTLKDTQEEGLGFYLNEANGNGAIMLRNLDDPDKYKSAEFAAISIDQLEMNSLDTFNLVRGSKRWPGIANTKFLATANPGGVGHGFIKRYWIDRDFPPEMKKLSEQFKFIQSLPADNPYLQQTYWDELNSLPPDLQKAWVEGDWNIFEGQAFNQFRRDKHVVQPFEVPVSWPRWRGIDWGYNKPFCCLWLAKDPDTERQYAYRELYEAELTDRQQARRVLEWTATGEAIQVTYADPSMWARKNVEDRVTSTADEYRAEGVILTKADNDRLSGKRKVDRLLANLPDGKPGLQIFENCVNLIRTLPALPYSKTQPEDVATEAEDHCLVAGTLVTTDKGDRPIEEIKVGNKVFTHSGFHPVIRSWMTKRNAMVYRVSLSDGKEITGTANHPIYVMGKGFVPIDALRYGDIIVTKENSIWTQKLLSSMGSNSGGIQIRETELAEHTMHQAATIASGALVSYIKKFGRACTALYRQAIASITETITRLITTSTIWNVWKLESIFQYTGWSTHLARDTWQESSNLQSNGIGRQKAGRGIRNMARKHGWIVNQLLSFAATVRKNTVRHLEESATFAQANAEPRIDVNEAWTIARARALFAVRNTQQTNTQTSEPVPSYAVRVCGVAIQDRPQDVYNLEVANEHEFFANGVLVHNCYDALRYAQTRVVKQAPHRRVQADANPLYDLIGR